MSEPMDLIQVLDQWDRVSGAIDKMVTALPAQMTDAAAILEAERRTMRVIIQAYATRAHVNPPQEEE